MLSTRSCRSKTRNLSNKIEKIYLNNNFLLFQDTFKLLTPGGGGYGRKDDEDNEHNSPSIATKFTERGSVYEFRSLQESA
jgi:N-methylhydantoinase B/oxoprolinase/acetone carboxylase alpha subunit